MTEKLKNAPIYYALVQAQFSPVAAMSEYINSIQDKLRFQGYPHFVTQTISQLNIDPAFPSKPQIIDLPFWKITSSDYKSGFILSQSQLVFHTTDYQTHAKFFDSFMLGLQEIHSIVKFDHLTRLGLRYLNAVFPGPTETLKLYLQKEVHGIKVETKLRYSYYESVFDTPILNAGYQGTLINRIYGRYGILGYPPDIAPPELIPAQKFIKKEPRDHGIIDIDHFIVEKMSLDSELINNRLASLHKELKVVFKANTTPYAKKVWNQ